MWVKRVLKKRDPDRVTPRTLNLNFSQTQPIKVYSTHTFSVMFPGQIRSSFFGHLDNPLLNFASLVTFAFTFTHTFAVTFSVAILFRLFSPTYILS